MPEKVDTGTSNFNILKFFRENWVIFVFMGSLVVTWTQFQSRISNLETEVSTLQSQNNEIASHLASIDVSVAQINTTLKYISNTTNTTTK